MRLHKPSPHFCNYFLWHWSCFYNYIVLCHSNSFSFLLIQIHMERGKIKTSVAVMNLRKQRVGLVASWCTSASKASRPGSPAGRAQTWTFWQRCWRKACCSLGAWRCTANQIRQEWNFSVWKVSIRKAYILCTVEGGGHSNRIKRNLRAFLWCGVIKKITSLENEENAIQKIRCHQWEGFLMITHLFIGVLQLLLDPGLVVC